VLAEVVDVGPVLVAPLTGSEQTRGVLAVARMAGRHPFQPEDLQLAAAFANQASIALEVSEARLERERAALLDERDRIAADLHDRVVQRLFGAGLTLHGVASRSADKAVVDGAAEVVHALDDAITELRSSIFGFRSGADPTEEPPSR
jgi:signal transduction histidine kinase